jgi:hypothetical protein
MTSKQPPRPPKGASPAQIKAWVAANAKSWTAAERAEYDEAGKNFAALMTVLGINLNKEPKQ